MSGYYSAAAITLNRIETSGRSVVRLRRYTCLIVQRSDWRIEVIEGSNTELKAVQDALAALWPLDEEARARAVAGIAGALGVSGTPVSVAAKTGGPPGSGVPGAISSNGTTGDLGTPKQFLAYKAPGTDIERITILAYYLTHARETPHFTTKELSTLNTEAAGPRFSNAAYTASNATKKNGFLTGAPGGKRQITARGEALVEALPDREAAKAVLESMPGKPRRSGAGRKKKA